MLESCHSHSLSILCSMPLLSRPMGVLFSFGTLQNYQLFYPELSQSLTLYTVNLPFTMSTPSSLPFQNPCLTLQTPTPPPKNPPLPLLANLLAKLSKNLVSKMTSSTLIPPVPRSSRSNSELLTSQNTTPVMKLLP
jgi:hypothetical protein